MILLCQSARVFEGSRCFPPQEENLMAAAKKPAAAAKKPAAKKTTARKPNAAFMKAMTPSAALAKIVGDKPLPRTEVVKKVWAYVKKNNLQDKKEKRNINADEALKEVFGGKKTVSMFEMTKLMNDNLS
jgi:upstream activation factor subunit UAF30